MHELNDMIAIDSLKKLFAWCHRAATPNWRWTSTFATEELITGLADVNKVLSLSAFSAAHLFSARNLTDYRCLR